VDLNTNTFTLTYRSASKSDGTDDQR
jgi:hypothetical protein